MLTDKFVCFEHNVLFDCIFSNITIFHISKTNFTWFELINLTLTHWGRVTHICVSKLTIIGSDNGLSPGRRQAIFWTNAGILLIWTLGTNFSEILSAIHAFSFKNMHLKMSSAKWRPFCLGLNVLTSLPIVYSCLWIKTELKCILWEIHRYLHGCFTHWRDWQ